MVNPVGGGRGYFPEAGGALGDLWELWGLSGSSGGALEEKTLIFLKKIYDFNGKC